MEQKLKVVLVGSSYVGKTSLIAAYTQKQFIDVYTSTVFDNSAVSLMINHRRYSVGLFDTSGKENYEELRQLSYLNANVILLCFSLVDRKSFEACTEWAVEIRKNCGEKSKIVLIGTKEDLVNTKSKENVVSDHEAEILAIQLGCYKYLKCSSLTHKGLKRAFDEAYLVALGLQENVEQEEAPSDCCCSFV